LHKTNDKHKYEKNRSHVDNQTNSPFGKLNDARFMSPYYNIISGTSSLMLCTCIYFKLLQE